MLEQIKRLKEGEQQNQDTQNEVDKSNFKEELLRLRRHNQGLLTQVRMLKHDNKSLQEE